MNGQWGVREMAGVWVGPAIQDSNGMGVAFVCGAASDRDRAVRMARLIAAAPEMLAALRIADDALDYAQAQVDSEGDRKRLLHWRTQVLNAISLTEVTNG
jgi:hypothetical protein